MIAVHAHALQPEAEAHALQPDTRALPYGRGVMSGGQGDYGRTVMAEVGRFAREPMPGAAVEGRTPAPAPAPGPAPAPADLLAHPSPALPTPAYACTVPGSTFRGLGFPGVQVIGDRGIGVSGDRVLAMRGLLSHGV